MKKILAILLMSGLMSSAASALDCSAKVKAVRIMKGGTVEIKMDGLFGEGYFNVCNVTYTYSGVAQETCKSWISIALTAKASVKELKLWGVQSDTCATTQNSGLVIAKLSVANN